MGLSFNPRVLCSLPGLLKFIQILVGVIAIILLRAYELEFSKSSILGNPEDYRDRQMTGVIAIGASLIISLVLLVGYIFFDCANSLLESLFCITAAILNCAGGALAIQTYHDMEHSKDHVQAGLGMASLMIINTLLYLVDAVTGGVRSTK